MPACAYAIIMMGTAFFLWKTMCGVCKKKAGRHVITPPICMHTLLDDHILSYTLLEVRDYFYVWSYSFFMFGHECKWQQRVNVKAEMREPGMEPMKSWKGICYANGATVGIGLKTTLPAIISTNLRLHGHHSFDPPTASLIYPIMNPCSYCT